MTSDPRDHHDDHEAAAPPERGAEPEASQGVRCPTCWSRLVPVIYTRHRIGGKTVRRRKCHHCGREFSTTERVTG